MPSTRPERDVSIDMASRAFIEPPATALHAIRPSTRGSARGRRAPRRPRHRLQPQDVDLEAGTVLVRRTWTRQRLGPTKTGRERRVAFGDQIVEDTLEWRPRADVIDAMVTKIRRLKRAPLNPTGFLFTQLDGASLDLNRR